MSNTVRSKTLVALACASFFTTPVAALTLAQFPLFLSTGIKPNVLVLYDNSQSMDGTMGGRVIAGDDPTTRGNIARRILRDTITTYRGSFNWGLGSFAYAGAPTAYTTYAYYIGNDVTMTFTNDCVSGISVTNGSRRCIPNPQPNNGFAFLTYDRTGDDPEINDVLYTGNAGPFFWGMGDIWTDNVGANAFRYCVGPNRNPTTGWGPGDFAGFWGCLSFFHTDAGFLPLKSIHPRQVWVQRAWGYLNDVTGGGVINQQVQADSTTHYNSLMTLLGQEQLGGTPEIKNAATFTALAGTLRTAKSYFSGAIGGMPSPITHSCQANYVILATDGNPTARTNGSMYPLEEMVPSQVTDSAGNWIFRQAALDVFPEVTGLRSTVTGGSTYDIKTYVVGLGDSVQNASSIATLNQYANLGGTGSAYLADNETALSEAFGSIAAEIYSANASAASVALSRGSWNTGTRVFQAKFDSSDWSGQLLAYPINQDGSLGTAIWNAATQINAQNFDTGRHILTYKPSAALGARGVPFRWPTVPNLPTATQIDATQSSLLNADGFGGQRLNYLRGDKSREVANCPGCTPAFRNRPTTVLGDFVNSAPFYVAAPSAKHGDSFESAPYSAFVRTWKSRTPIIYVAANDGMLHGFNATTGKEEFAYVPSMIYNKAATLSNIGYTHTYSVDGSPMIADVFYAGGWRTLLAAGLGAGGRGLYALDVTNPSLFRESTASNVVRWEVRGGTSASGLDPDMGSVLASPTMAKLPNGRWYVISGNGYDSVNNEAVLYLIDAETGTPIKIRTQAGGSANNNGLSGVAAVSSNNNNVADIIYAGDLLGNLWKFDVSSTNPNQWDVAFAQGGSPRPLFQAQASQPITGRPDVMALKTGEFVVVFGTGQYLQTTDVSTTNVQTVYGVVDRGSRVTMNDLQQQRVFGTGVSGGHTYRITSHAVGPATIDSNIVNYDNLLSSTAYSSGKKGWYLNLPDTGERTITDFEVVSGKAVFTSMIPSTNPCSAGGSGWLMEVDAFTGNRHDAVTLDTNGDGNVTTADFVRPSAGVNNQNVTGRRIGSIPSSPSFLRTLTRPAPGGPGVVPVRTDKYLNTSSGQVVRVREADGTLQEGRTSWRELR